MTFSTATPLDRAFWIPTWCVFLLGVPALGVAYLWETEASRSVSSTAGIGHLFAFLLAVPVTLALLLGLVGLLLHPRAPAAARVLSAVGASIVTLLAVLALRLYLPDLLI